MELRSEQQNLLLETLFLLLEECLQMRQIQSLVHPFLLKNTVGIAGVAILLIIVAFPAIKILMIAFIYKFAAAILQPLGGGSDHYLFRYY